MPLREVKIAPGINKQVTPTGAEGKWIDCDNVRFRYGYPEKIGGWEQTTTNTLVGVTRAMHIWSDVLGRRFIALGTNKALFVYYDGAFFDITPLGTALTSCTLTTSNGSSTVTINKSAHGLTEGDLFLFSSVTLPGGGATSYSGSDFTTNTFQVVTAGSDSFTVTMANNETGTGISSSGSVTVTPYFDIGDALQVAGYGWGTGRFGGEAFPLATSTLNGALLNDSNGTGGSGTTIALASTSNFSATGGTIKVDNELITYTGVSGSNLTGISRGASGTSTAAHSDATTVEESSDYFGWGDATNQAVTVLEPGNWSLDNFGEILIGTVRNNKSFQWNPGSASPLTTRATVISGAPEKSVMTLVSDRDRHLIHLGTEPTIASGTQDKMFIRFSDQESLTDYAPTSTNTAGTFRIDNGTKIVGGVNAGSYNLILTDTAAYTMRFIGSPFTFGIEQVGANCGLISQHGVVAVNGVVYWMGQAGGFYLFDGTVKKIPCSVEDFVFTTTDNGDLGLNFDSSDVIFAGYNSLFGEINWFYPKAGSTQIDRVVTYNYLEGVWTIGSLARTTYYDKTIFDNPYASAFDDSAVPTFPTIQGVTNVNGATTLYVHEKGNNEVNNLATTPIVGSIQSGDFEVNTPELGTGEFFIKVRRFVPDFRALTGNAQITINLKDFPSDTESSSSLGPFTVSPTTQKIDTRARARAANLKIENTARDETWRYGTFKADTQVDGRR